MPLYEFLCLECGHQFEAIISNTDIYSGKCPHCESTKLDRLYSPFGGYHIKGDNSASVRPKGAGSRSKKV